MVTAELKKIKKCHILTIFPVLEKLTHMCKLNTVHPIHIFMAIIASPLQSKWRTQFSKYMEQKLMKPSKREISNSLPIMKFISLLERPYFCGQCRLIHNILAFYEDIIWTSLPALFMAIYANTLSLSNFNFMFDPI